MLFLDAESGSPSLPACFTDRPTLTADALKEATALPTWHRELAPVSSSSSVDLRGSPVDFSKS